MESIAGTHQNNNGNQARSTLLNKDELIGLFIQGKGISKSTAAMAFDYFSEHPVIHAAGSVVSNLTLDTVKHLYESLPEPLPDGRAKLTAMVALIRQIIFGTTGVDFNDRLASSPQNEFVDYLVVMITNGVENDHAGACEAFAECITEIRTLKDGNSAFEYCYQKMSKELHTKCLALTFEAGITKANVAEAWKFYKDNPTLLTVEIAEQISVQIARQYTAGLDFFHAYNDRGNDQDLADAVTCFRCCFDQGQDFINSDVQRKLAGHDIKEIQTSVSYSVYAVSYSAYALFHVHTLVQSKTFSRDEAIELTKWFSNIPEISFKNRLDDHLAGKIVLSLEGMRLVISMLQPLFNDPRSLFSALDKYAERPGEIAQACDEFQKREKLFKQAARMDNESDDLNLKATYLFKIANGGYLDVDEELQSVFSLISSVRHKDNTQHVLDLTPAMAKHAAAYFNKYPEKTKCGEFQFLFNYVSKAIKHQTLKLSDAYVDLALCANFKPSKHIVAYMKRAADEHNHAKAALWYAHHLLNKNKPTLKNDAIKYYRRSADLGHVPAQQWLAISGFHQYAYMVGVQHLYGSHAQGVIKDEDAAINWLSMAAKDPRALWVLGIIEEQRGNRDEAKEYFKRAFELGHLPAALEKSIGELLARAELGDILARLTVTQNAAALSELYKETHPAYFPKPDLKRAKKYADLANRFAVEPETITLDNAEK